MTLKEQAKKAKQASYALIEINSKQINDALLLIAKKLEEKTDYITRENQKDMQEATLSGMESSKIDRLKLDNNRISQIAKDVRNVANLPDVVGDFTGFTRADGLEITKISVPLGVVGMIYESRPNVTVDAAVLCLKSANATLLRGGKEAKHSNHALVTVIKEAIVEAGLPADAVMLVADTSRETVLEMMKLDEYLDLLIPRGGANLIKTVKENATVPIIETGTGNCHIYIHEEADEKMAIDIIKNAKIERPSVCNACESIVIDEMIASTILPKLFDELKAHNVKLKGCEKTVEIINIPLATSEDFYTEYNDLIATIKIVENAAIAITHINEHSTKHSEAIITNNHRVAKTFLKLIDSACVYHNASTRFSDGSELGFGAEIGISTQKLHARGPFALKELTTYKYIITGQGHIRP